MCQFFHFHFLEKNSPPIRLVPVLHPLGLVSTVSEILDPPLHWMYTQYPDHFQVPIVAFRNYLVELSHTIIHFYQVELRAVDLLVSVFTHVYHRVKSLFTIVGNIFRKCPITFNTYYNVTYDVLRWRVCGRKVRSH